jgi:hypothetical protein
MLQKMRVLLTVSVVAALTACGGDSTPTTTPAPAATPTPTPVATLTPEPTPTPTPIPASYAGNYSVSMSMTSDPCGGISYPQPGTAVVTQNGQSITFYKQNITNGAGADTFTGAVDAGDSGFTASSAFTVTGNLRYTYTISFSGVPTSGTYTVQMRLTRGSPSSSGCTATFAGTAVKI